MNPADGDPTPLPPRRPKRPPVPDYDLDDEPSTFQPSPTVRRGSSSSSSGAKRRRPPEPVEDAEAEPDFSSRGAVRPKRPRPASSAESDSGKSGKTLVFGRVKAGDLAVFCRQLGVYLDSGVGINRALASLKKPMAGTAMAPVIDRLIEAVKGGQSIADSAAKEPEVFDRLFLSMVRVAEERGGLPETLKRLGSLYETRERLWRQARSAMVYPIAVIVVALAVGALLTMFVLPKLIGILRDVVRDKPNFEFPLPTRMLMALSDFMQAFGWWLVPLLLVGGTFFLKRWYGTAGGKSALDRIMVRFPVMGKLLSLIDSARFARTLGDLLEAGVPLDRSLALTSEAVQFVPFQEAVKDIRASVKAGSEITPALRETGRFEPDLIAFAETGEETGNLPESLLKVAEDYEERVDVMTKNLGALVQPLLIIVLGAIVGFIVIAFVMAYVSILSGLMGG